MIKNTTESSLHFQQSNWTTRRQTNSTKLVACTVKLSHNTSWDDRRKRSRAPWAVACWRCGKNLLEVREWP